VIREFVQVPFLRQTFLSSLQQEKEALDDLAMELELADEDQPVLYVQTHLAYTSASRLIHIFKLQGWRGFPSPSTSPRNETLGK
jgi:hypothetical protein